MKISTAQEAINGNSNDTVITPLRLKQVLNSKNIGGGGSGVVTKETDPIFKSSPAAKITDKDIENWNSGTGDVPDTDVTDFNTKWENAELTSDFKLYNDASYCRYAKVGNLVNIQFVLSPASANNVLNSYTETTAFVLPKEYRPSQNLTVLCQGSNLNVFVVGVNTSGNVNIYRYRSGDSLPSTPPGTSTWLPCNITYMIDSGTLIAGGSGGNVDIDDITSKMSKVLYDNPDGTNTIAQLTETYANFKYLEVFCVSSDNTYAYTRIDNPVDGKRATVMGGWFGSAAYFKNCVLVLSGGDKINVTQGNNAQITGSNACSSASLADAMKVVKVVGYYDENVLIVGNNGTEIVNTNKPKNIITAYLSKATSMSMTAWEAKKVPLDAFIGNGDKLKLENGSIVVGEGVNQVRINASIRLAAEFAAGYYCITIKVTKKDGTVLPVMAQYQQKHTVQVSNAIVISPYLENVSEGDIIDLLFTSSVTQTQSLVQNQVTSLTVEVVEDGQIITVNNTIDGIPIGSEFEYDGEEVPDGYEEVPSIVDIVYPVGAIFMSTSPTDPQLLFKGTEWKQLKDKFLLAAGDTYEAGTTGGSGTHKHSLTSGWANINSSGKTIIYQYKAGTSWKANYQVVGSSGSSSSTSYSDVTTLGGTTDNTNNLPPYLTVYMWERIA